MICDHLEGWDREGGREMQEGGDMGRQWRDKIGVLPSLIQNQDGNWSPGSGVGHPLVKEVQSQTSLQEPEAEAARKRCFVTAKSLSPKTLRMGRYSKDDSGLLFPFFHLNGRNQSIRSVCSIHKLFSAAR